MLVESLVKHLTSLFLYIRPHKNVSCYLTPERLPLWTQIRVNKTKELQSFTDKNLHETERLGPPVPCSAYLPKTLNSWHSVSKKQLNADAQ